MAIDFPSAGLTPGQIHTSGSRSWAWDGAKWGPSAAGASVGDISSVAAGPGLTGGGSTGDVTLSLATPVSIANGGTNATTAGAALANLGGISGNQSITLSGDISGSGATAIAATLATVNSNVGTFQGLTLDAKGRVTAAANQAYVTGGPYLPIAGGQTTGAVGINTPISAGGDAANFYAGALMGTNYGFNLYLNAAPVEWRHATGTGYGGLISFNSGLGAINFFSSAAGSAGSAATLTATAVISAVGDYQILGSVATKPGGGTWTAPSDVRLKTSVAPYETGLAAIVQLQPVTYEYNGEAGMPTGQTFHGVIADDAVVPMPETVGRMRLPMASEEESVEYLTFDSTPLTYALINAVKELTARLEALEAR